MTIRAGATFFKELLASDDLDAETFDDPEKFLDYVNGERKPPFPRSCSPHWLATLIVEPSNSMTDIRLILHPP